MTIGIYMLQFTGTKKVYIGQSNNIETRFNNHKYILNKGVGAKKLQTAYNIYGLPQLEILVECNEEDLNTCESESISIFNSIDDGFNTYSDTKRGSALHGQEHPNSKYSDNIIETVFNYLVDSPEKTQKEIESITGVKRSTIREISTGNNHTWLSDKYPDRYVIMLSRKHNRCTSAAIGLTYPDMLSPEGDIHKIENLREFAARYSLDRRNLYKLFKGTCKSVKGWTIHNV